MEQLAQTQADYRNRLDTAITAFGRFIRELSPEAQLEISFARYEDEDAHVGVTLPSTLAEDVRENFANRVAEKSLDFLIENGLLILVGIEENQ